MTDGEYEEYIEASLAAIDYRKGLSRANDLPNASTRANRTQQPGGAKDPSLAQEGRMKTSTSPRSKRKKRLILAVLLLAGVVAAVVYWNRDGGPGMPALPDAGVRVGEGEYVKLSREELLGVLSEARAAAAKLEDYSAVMLKHERIDGELGDEQKMFLKIRHEPFSVYLVFELPESIEGQEVLYVEGQNDGEMWAHGVGLEGLLGTLSLDPEGWTAMRGQKYPITSIGMLNLAERIASGVEEAAERGDAEADVRLFDDAAIDGRECRAVTIARTPADEGSPIRLMRLFLDKELGLLVRYEAYDWSGNKDEKPELVEKYTYVDVKPDRGFADGDFDTANPDYGFE